MTKIYKTRMLAEIQKAFKKQNCIVSGFGNQVSDAVAYKACGVHPNYVFHIKDSIIHMLSGKYKFSMESFYQNVEGLLPELTVNVSN